MVNGLFVDLNARGVSLENSLVKKAKVFEELVEFFLAWTGVLFHLTELPEKQSDSQSRVLDEVLFFSVSFHKNYLSSRLFCYFVEVVLSF